MKRQQIIQLVPNWEALSRVGDKPRLTSSAAGDKLPALEDAREQPSQEQPEQPQEAPEDELNIIAAMRHQLGKILRSFSPQWSGEDLQEWLEGNGYNKKSVHNVDELTEIIEKLKAVQPGTEEPF